MPSLRVNCPDCGSVLKIGNPALGGKTVACPKCGSRMTLPPADEWGDGPADRPPPPAPAPPPPRRRPEREEGDADDRPPPRRSRADRDAADDRPRRPKPAESSGRGKVWLFAGVGAAVVLAGAVAAVVQLRGKSRDTAGGGEGGKAVAADLRVIGPRYQFKLGFKPQGSSQLAEARTLFLTANGGRLFASSAGSGAEAVTRVWDLGGEPRQVGEYDGRINHLSADGTWVIREVKYTSDNADALTGRKLDRRSISGGEHMYPRADGTFVGVGRFNEWSKASPLRFYVQNPAGKDEMTVIGDDDRVVAAPPVNGGKDLCVGHGFSNTVRVIDVDARKVRREFQLSDARPYTGPGQGPSFSYLAVSPDGKWLAVERSSGSTPPLEIFDAATGTRAASLPRYAGGLNAAFAPGRDVYVTPSNITRPDPTGGRYDVVAYDIRKQEVVAAFRGHPEKSQWGITQLAVSADGKTMATSDGEGNVLVWDLGQLP